MKAQPIPPLAIRQQPGLSVTLPYPRLLAACQSCGVRAEFADLRKWQECDAFDQETPVVVVLCEKCEKRLITPHPRLYKSIQKNAPWPGAMEICIACRHQRDLDCDSPRRAKNGGPGVPLHQVPPIVAMVCPGGMMKLYNHPPAKCDAREEIELAGETRMTGDGGPGT